MSNQTTPVNNNEAAVEQDQAVKDKLEAIKKYAPGLEQGFTQEDTQRLIARLSLDKAAAEKHINYLVDQLISNAHAREILEAENAVLKSQLISLTKRLSATGKAADLNVEKGATKEGDDPLSREESGTELPMK